MTDHTPPTHPARLAVDKLLADCEIRRQRRSGPGGQHRNKVETAIVITHRPTGFTAEANERRSQNENQRVAVFRLRIRLALEHRSDVSGSESPVLPTPSPLWRSRCTNGRVSIRADHADFPALLSEVLDLWSLVGRDIKTLSGHLECTTSQLVKFFKLEPRAMRIVNNERESQGLAPLK